MKNNWHKLLTMTALSLQYSAVTLPVQASCGLVLDTTVTADNHYKLVTGPQNPGELQLIGRNEFGPFNVPDTVPPIPSESCPDNSHPFNWSCPESFEATISYYPSSNTSVNGEFYIYAFVWGESAVERTFLGQFAATGFALDNSILFSEALVTDEQWDVALVDNFNPGDFGDVSLGQISNFIVNANTNNAWVSATSQGFNQDTTLPWQQIPGIVPTAEFIADNSIGDDLDSLIFRRQVQVPVEVPPCPPPIHEPSMLLSLATFLGWSLQKKFDLFKNR